MEKSIYAQNDFPMKRGDIMKVKYPDGSRVFYHLTGESFKHPSKMEYKANVRQFRHRVAEGRNVQP